MTTTAVVVEAVRTPFARLDGVLAHLDAQALAALAVREAVARAGVAPGDVDDVLVAHAAGPGGNLARLAALDAGLPASVPGLTLDRQCGGGLDAVTLACRLIAAGAGELYVAVGVDSASTSPLRAEASRDAGAHGRGFFPRRAFSAGGWDDPGMAEAADDLAAARAIPRARQDAYAAASHARASASASGGEFDAEIVPCPGRDGGATVTRDECPRATLDAARCARMPPVVRPGGTVTAANASQIADGAVAVVVAAEGRARALGRGGLAFRDSVTVGVPPPECGLGAVAAARALATRDPRHEARAAHQVAMTEAFAAQVLATADDLQLDPARLNPRGGAIGLGHPWGASGAMQVLRLWRDLAPGHEGLALAAIAGGMGVAAWFAAVTW